MAEQFKEQGGAATMNPSRLLRWLTSRIMTRMSNPARLSNKRSKFEKQRLKSGQAHVVEYFHQVDDGYSHLAAQVLQSMAARYDIELVCHLVTGPKGDNVPEPDLLMRLSRYDSFHVASDYGLEFPEHNDAPNDELLKLGAAVLAAQDSVGFTNCAEEVGRAIWAGDQTGLQALAECYGSATEEQVKAKISAGCARREELQHYSGGMFYYGQEWYWGVDRLYHLEKRLAELDVDRSPGKAMVVPRPPIEAGELKDNASLTLEIYPSLRSPYTAIIFDRVVKLAADTGVNLLVRPVLPMVMRGVPATRQKGMYIFQDAAREAREADIPYGNFYDPIGDPARRCYSLYPWANEQGKSVELISSFLSCAFARGVNTNTDSGLKTVVEGAGLDWIKAKSVLGTSGWEELLESNRLAMYDAGLWGVPSFQLLDAKGQQVLALWGQDRLWLFAREIQRQLANQL